MSSLEWLAMGERVAEGSLEELVMELKLVVEWAMFEAMFVAGILCH